LERRSIEAALLAVGGNKSRAAAELGISRFALQRKLEKYGLAARETDEGNS
jgi:DNA-binding NtrC family response regulator